MRMKDQAEVAPAARSPDVSSRKISADIRAVLFDAGDIIYRRRRNPARFVAFLNENGFRTPSYEHPDLKAFKRDAHAGRISRDAFFDAVLDRCGSMSPEQREAGRAILASAQGEIDFFAGVPETLLRLKQAGLRLAIVTNTFDATATKLEWFRRVGIDTIWDSFATSCELKLIKPRPGIYLAALAPLDLYPSQAAFVGHAKGELQGAKALGLTTIAFNRDSDMVTADYIIDAFGEVADLLTPSGEEHIDV
jgi:HAD superfamily hydrolase (TIGR01509 family)